MVSHLKGMLGTRRAINHVVTVVTLGSVGEVTTALRAITEVTFTRHAYGSSIQSWFGSSGGGLPRRPVTEKSRALFF